MNLIFCRQVGDRTFSMQEEGSEDFCGRHEKFYAFIDGQWNIFQNFWWATKYFIMFYFCNIIFHVRWLEHKLSKLTIKEIRERQSISNKSHPLIHSADIRQIVVKIKKCLTHFDPDARVFDLSNWHKTQLFVRHNKFL